MIEGVRRQWAGLLALFLLLTGAGAYAAIDPVGSDGDVDACFAKRTGDLDLLTGRRCGKGEKPVTWNAEGPRGPRGEQGPPGERGAPGADGAPGSAGPAGSTAASMLMGRVLGPDMPPDVGLYMPLGSGEGAFFESTAISPNATVALRDLSAWVSEPPGPGGASWTISIGVRNGIATLDPAITCEIAGAFNQTCDSGDQTVTIPPSSGLYLRVARSGGAADADLSYGYRATTPSG
jgi:hypothetical protein